MKEYYSNCLIEAIKAKIKNPKIKLKYIPAKLNERFIFHLMWQDDIHTYDFYVKGKLNFLQLLWHKGTIRVNDLGYYDKAIETLRKYKQRS